MSAMQNQAAPLEPTFFGIIASNLDALIVIEGALSGTLPHVPRRPHDRERTDLIQSGNVFIYEEHASGIKRWTDGVSWSPSRILGNFLVYRELDTPFPPGEKKRATKRQKADTDIGLRKLRDHLSTKFNIDLSDNQQSQSLDDKIRSLIGSLTESYPFREVSGLVKKTISVTYRGVAHHLVSYYSIDDAFEGILKRPTDNAELRAIIPRQELLFQQNFRNQFDEWRFDSNGMPMLSTGAPIQLPMYYHPNATAMPRGVPAYNPVSMSGMAMPSPAPAYPMAHAGHHYDHPHYQQPHAMPPAVSPYSHAGSGNTMMAVSYPHGNYALDAERSNRYPSGVALPHEYRPTTEPPRRHSEYDSAAGDVNSLGLQSLPETRPMESTAPFAGPSQGFSYLSHGLGVSGDASHSTRVAADNLTEESIANHTYPFGDGTASWEFNIDPTAGHAPDGTFQGQPGDDSQQSHNWSNDHRIN